MLPWPFNEIWWQLWYSGIQHHQGCRIAEIYENAISMEQLKKSWTIFIYSAVQVLEDSLSVCYFVNQFRNSHNFLLNLLKILSSLWNNCQIIKIIQREHLVFTQLTVCVQYLHIFYISIAETQTLKKFDIFYFLNHFDLITYPKCLDNTQTASTPVRLWWFSASCGPFGISGQWCTRLPSCRYHLRNGI